MRWLGDGSGSRNSTSMSVCRASIGASRVQISLPAALTRERARHVAALVARDELELDLGAGARTQADPRAPSPRVLVLERDRGEALAMQPGQMLPVAHVLPYARERGADPAPVHRDRDESGHRARA
jgi:hypothetical protein